MAIHADWTRLMKTLTVRLPGALEDVIKLELFSIADEFLRVSQLWTEEIIVVTTEDETFYEIEAEATTSKINRLINVKNADERLISATMAVIGELVLTNEPPADESYTVTVALSIADPTDTNNFPRIPTWILEKYRETFLDGTLGRMMSIPAKPYSNERMSVYHLRRFRDGMAQARVDARHKNVDSANSWQFPRGWA
jgi:hypothetical protein